jgi:hypothetical protein
MCATAYLLAVIEHVTGRIGIGGVSARASKWVGDPAGPRPAQGSGRTPGHGHVPAARLGHDVQRRVGHGVHLAPGSGSCAACSRGWRERDQATRDRRLPPRTTRPDPEVDHRHLLLHRSPIPAASESRTVRCGHRSHLLCAYCFGQFMNAKTSVDSLGLFRVHNLSILAW